MESVHRNTHADIDAAHELIDVLQSNVRHLEESNAALLLKIRQYVDAVQALYNAGEVGRGNVIQYFGFSTQPSMTTDQGARP